MERVLNYIKSWFTAPIEPTRKRRAFDDLEFEGLLRSPKYRRLNASPLTNGYLDEDIFGFSRKRSPITPIRKNKQDLRLVDSICLDDDDDDVIVVVPSKENINKMSNINKTSQKSNKGRFTSTPASVGTKAKAKPMVNGNDDVQFVRDYKLTPIPKANSHKTPLGSFLNPIVVLDDCHNGTKPKFNLSPKEVEKTTPTPYRKPLSTVDHLYRLEEKVKYRELLEKTAPNYSGTSNDSSGYHTPYGKFNYDTSSRGGKILSMVNRSGKEKTGEFVRKVLDSFEKEPIEVSDSESDVEILPKPPTPKPDIKVDPVNTLKPVIESTETTRPRWLGDLIRSHREVIEQRQNEIEQYTKQYKTLHDINTDIRIGALANRVDRSLSIRDYVLPEEDAEEEELPELTEEHYLLVKRAFSGNPNEVLAKKFNLNITRRDLQTLQNLNWLNDEVINFYMNLIAERGKGHPRYPKTHTMNTFFYSKLVKDGPESLRRWTKKIDIFSYDLICIPIHLGVHWCMAAIDLKQCTIKYYDSMGGNNSECTRRLKRYLEFEHMDKKRTEYDSSDFVLEDVKDIPQQMNGSDCGMFSCMFAEYLSRNVRITFTQEHMPYFRKKMVVEIMKGELLLK